MIQRPTRFESGVGTILKEVSPTPPTPRRYGQLATVENVSRPLTPMDAAFISSLPLARPLGSLLTPRTARPIRLVHQPNPAFTSTFLSPLLPPCRTRYSTSILPHCRRRPPHVVVMRRTSSSNSGYTARKRYHRSPRHRTSSSSRRRRDGGLSMNEITRTFATLWRDASPISRVILLTGAAAAFSVTAAALNAVIHVSFALAFAAVPIIMAPVLLTLFAGVSVFAILAVATAGAGFIFVGTPLFMVGLVAKAFLPAFVTVGLGALFASNMFKVGGSAVRWLRDGFSSYDEDEDEEDDDEMDYDEDEDDVDAFFDDRDDQLAEFDRLLRRRSASASSAFPSSSSSPAAATVPSTPVLWSISDVVDELDDVGLGRYRQLFIDERVDGRTLLSLSEEDIRAEFASMPLGDRRRLARLVESLRRRTK